MILSRHAESRSQQRAINPKILEILVAFGGCRRRRGADVFFMTKDSHRRLKNKIGEEKYKRLKGKLGVYAIISDDSTVITVAHRTKRLKFR